MARNGDLRIRVNRAEMRVLKAGAKALGGRPVATWARETLLAAARALEPVKAAPAAEKPALPLDYLGPNPKHTVTVFGTENGRPVQREIAPRTPLVKTYDPDQA